MTHSQEDERHKEGYLTKFANLRGVRLEHRKCRLNFDLAEVGLPVGCLHPQFCSTLPCTDQEPLADPTLAHMLPFWNNECSRD